MATVCRPCAFRSYSLGVSGGDGLSMGEQLRGERFSALKRLGGVISGATDALWPEQAGGASRVITTPYGLLTGNDTVKIYAPAPANIDVNVKKNLSPLDSLLQEAISFIKRTFQPSLIRRKRKHGFLHRMRTKDGRTIMNNRRRKGRRKLCA